MDKENEEERAAELKPLKLYTLREVAYMLDLSHRTLLTYARDGRLPARKIGGKWRVSIEQLNKFLAGHLPPSEKRRQAEVMKREKRAEKLLKPGGKWQKCLDDLAAALPVGSRIRCKNRVFFRFGPIQYAPGVLARIAAKLPADGGDVYYHFESYAIAAGDALNDDHTLDAYVIMWRVENLMDNIDNIAAARDWTRAEYYDALTMRCNPSLTYDVISGKEVWTPIEFDWEQEEGDDPEPSDDPDAPENWQHL